MACEESFCNETIVNEFSFSVFVDLLVIVSNSNYVEGAIIFKFIDDISK